MNQTKPTVVPSEKKVAGTTLCPHIHEGGHKVISGEAGILGQVHV